MNSLERFRAFTRRRPTDRPLCYASFTPDLATRLRTHTGAEDLAAYFDMDDYRTANPAEPAGYAPPDYAPYYAHMALPEATRISAVGVAHKPGGFFHFTEIVSPLSQAAHIRELEEYPIEDYSTWDMSSVKNEVDAIHAAGKIAAVALTHLYEDAWQIRGYEAFLMDMMDRPQWCEVILDKLQRRNMARAVAGAEAGADMLICGDDVANQNALMFSPDTWRRLLHARWKRVWAAAREAAPHIQIWYHSDGNILPIIGELADAGVSLLNPIQPECMDLDAVAAQYGARLLFDGGMGTQSVFPFGSPRDIRDCVRQRLRQFGRGVILSPTHVLEPEVPIDNILAFFDACHSARVE